MIGTFSSKSKRGDDIVCGLDSMLFIYLLGTVRAIRGLWAALPDRANLEMKMMKMENETGRNEKIK